MMLDLTPAEKVATHPGAALARRAARRLGETKGCRVATSRAGRGARPSFSLILRGTSLSFKGKDQADAFGLWPDRLLADIIDSAVPRSGRREDWVCGYRLGSGDGELG